MSDNSIKYIGRHAPYMHDGIDISANMRGLTRLMCNSPRDDSIAETRAFRSPRVADVPCARLGEKEQIPAKAPAAEAATARCESARLSISIFSGGANPIRSANRNRAKIVLLVVVIKPPGKKASSATSPKRLGRTSNTCDLAYFIRCPTRRNFAKFVYGSTTRSTVCAGAT